MLENIKLVLGLSLNDRSQDVLINYYINKVTNNVLAYCNLNELPYGLNGFVEDKVISIMQYKLNLKSNENEGIKSISRGDTRLEFVNQAEINEKDLISLKASEKVLNKFRKVKW